MNTNTNQRRRGWIPRYVLVTGREDGLLHPELTQPVAQSCERCTNGVFCANHEAQS